MNIKKLKLSRRTLLISAMAVCLAVAAFFLIYNSSAFYLVSNEGPVSEPVEEYEFIVNSDNSSDSFAFDLSSVKKPGDSQRIPFSVSNGESDLEQNYSIAVSYFKNLPLEFTLEKDGSAIPLSELESGYAIYNQSLREQTDHYVLTVTWPSAETDLSYIYEIDLVTVTLEAEQVEPN